MQNKIFWYNTFW